MSKLDEMIDNDLAILTVGSVRYGGGFAAFLTTDSDVAGIIADMLGGSDIDGTDTAMLGNCWFPFTWRDTVTTAVAALEEKIAAWSTKDHQAFSLYCQAVRETSAEQHHYGLRNAGKRFEELMSQDWNLDTEKYLLDLPGV